MIIDGIIGALLGVIYNIIDLIPDINYSINLTFIDTVLTIIRSVGYFLPMPTVITIASMSISITLFKVVISFLKTFWDILPFT